MSTHLIAGRPTDPQLSRPESDGRLPAWSILHVPHDSTVIPPKVRDQFVLSDAALAEELVVMTDAHTGAIFGRLVPPAQCLCSAVSRLVVDVERFEDDAAEIMATRGMGAVYMQTSRGTPLRRPLAASEREALLADYYRPHHRELDRMVEVSLAAHGRALVLDVHSFPSRPRLYDLDQTSERTEICIGTDEFHTPRELAAAFLTAFRAEGFTVSENVPFAGSIVPQRHYRRDARVNSVMVEVNRAVYMDEATGDRSSGFTKVSAKVRRACAKAVGVYFG